ncbi:hypothetical protein [Haloferax sp. DFSO60]|uniref:hypothetical protein n=1 Tax=Haloferax sp. DFSO60 TaxID=3388652 RepID=UPI00397A2B04
MPNWTVYNFECEDVSSREALMEWFEANHPVEFPADDDSVFADYDNGERTVGADYAWIDRYLYVTVMGEAETLVAETLDLWNRAAIAEFDSKTETVTDITLIVDTEAGRDDEIAAVKFEGEEGYGGNDVMYALAMAHQFRFRAYSAQSPTSQITPHPAAFDYVTNVDAFVEDLGDVTGVEPTDEGLEFIRTDPAIDYKVARDDPTESDERGVDRVTVVDTDTGEVTAYNSGDEVPEEEEKKWVVRPYSESVGMSNLLESSAYRIRTSSLSTITTLSRRLSAVRI